MDTNSYKLKPIANKESLTHPDSTMGSDPSFSVAQGGLQHFVIGGARIAWTWTHAPCMYTPHVVKKNEPK